MAGERDRLSEEIHRLGNLLGETLVEQEGRALYDLVEEVRALAKAHRAGDEAAGEQLVRRIEGLPLAEARGVLKAFASYFKLVNLAEEASACACCGAASARPTPRAARPPRRSRRRVRHLREAGDRAAELQPLLDRLLIQPVFTAHPTEAKRRTILTKLARLADVLRAPDRGEPTPVEERAADEALREELVSLWQTEETRAYRPEVMDEVSNGLYYFETTLYDLAPEMRAPARARPGAALPGRTRSVPRFLRFGSWIGGDRDGNPFVTVAATEQALRAHHELALRLLRRGIERLHGHLSTTERLGVLPRAAREPRARRPRVPERSAGRRRALSRTSRTARSCATSIAGSAPCSRRARRPGAPTTCRDPGAYRDADELVADLRLLQASLRAHRGGRLADGRLGTLVRQAEIFGFHLASLDLRQHSAAPHERARRGARRATASPRATRRWTRSARARVLTDEIRAGPAVRPAPARLQPRDRTRRSSSSGSCAAPTSASARARSRPTSSA